MTARSWRTTAGIAAAAAVFLLAGLVALLSLAWDKNSFAYCLDVDFVRSWLARTGMWAPLAYMAVMALVVATPLPSLPLNFAAGMHFGPVLGTLYSVTGATAGALINFFAARLLGRRFVERFLKGTFSSAQPAPTKS